MKGSFYEFTDEGRRNLMRLLAIELSDEKIKEITEKYTERLLIDRRDGEPLFSGRFFPGGCVRLYRVTLPGP